jgi:hypothetical protein
MNSSLKFLLFIFVNLNFSDYEIDYLGFRFFIGFWIMTFLLIMVATDLSFLVKYITRFTGKDRITYFVLLN